MATREQLRAAGGGAGMTEQELIQAGLTPLEASTRAMGFTGAFGGGRAKAFREQLTKQREQAQQQTPTAVTDYMSNLIQNPSLPTGTTMVPTTMKVNKDELLNNIKLGTAPTIDAAPTIAPDTNIDIAQAQAPQDVNVDDVVNNLGIGEQVTPYLTSTVTGLDPVEIAVAKEATVKGQLADLFADVESGEVPAWARTAYNMAEEAMSARGLASSSIAAGAIALAAMQSALPIAAQDAQTYYGAALQNATFDQQARLEQFKARQQNMLTDVAIQNAAEQINASSKQQTQQFVASLISNIRSQNADRLTAIETLNVQQTNALRATIAQNNIEVAKVNAAMQLEVDKYNSAMKNQREQFEVSNRLAIDQSNTNWRRSINTSNTAAINAANATNVQNLLNMSSQALNNLWLEYRDNAYWANTSAENEAQRAYNSLIASGNREWASRNDDLELGIATGKTLIDIARLISNKG